MRKNGFFKCHKMKVARHLLPGRLNEACVCRLIKEGVKRDDAYLPLLCDEKQRESWANRSGFSNFSSLTLIQKQFSAISWGTICNDTRIPLSPQSETAIPPTCHSKSSSHWRCGLCVCVFCSVRGHTHALACASVALREANKNRKRPRDSKRWRTHINLTTLNDDVRIDPDFQALVDLSWDEWNTGISIHSATLFMHPFYPDLKQQSAHTHRGDGRPRGRLFTPYSFAPAP